ncbi:hypothetical protein BU17DRAFT_63469 [Hysterangium stoloniferum]|nr:hypothetical protein BU17DRAFT_63469 [Hysterangium stoloniferum]
MALHLLLVGQALHCFASVTFTVDIWSLPLRFRDSSKAAMAATSRGKLFWGSAGTLASLSVMPPSLLIEYAGPCRWRLQCDEHVVLHDILGVRGFIPSLSLYVIQVD